MNYKQGDIDNIHIGMYVQQLFFNQLDHLKEQEDGINIIKSQYVLLDKELTEDILTIDVDNDDEIIISPLLKSLSIGKTDIHLWEEYHWILSDEELKKLKVASKDEYMWYQHPMRFLSNDHEINVSFKIGICRKVDDSDRTGFRLSINGIKSTHSALDGSFSIMVDEIEYIDNNWPVRDIKDNERVEVFFFKDKLIQQLSTLSIHFAVRFW